MECIGKFCKDEYDIIIVDNSDKPEVIEAIKYYVSNLKCLYYKTRATSSNASDSHTFACNFAYMTLKNNYGYFAFLDHDIFPIREFSIKEILTDKIIAGIGQEKSKKYIWAGCVLFDNNKIDHDLIDFSTNHELQLDTGGQLYKVIEKYGEGACMFFNETYHQNEGFNKTFYNWYATINNDMFMHFVNASNWNPTERHQERINSLLNILEEKIKDK